jgi:hypothetical protein
MRVVSYEYYSSHFKHMKLKFITTAINLGFASTILSLFFVQSAYTQTPKSPTSPLLQQATQLRTEGAKGLEIFLKTHGKELNNPSPEMRIALDTLCQQKDCHASQLFWYTDLEQAKAAAKTSGKPILSLRLLGNLDQDLSCANSRFFRVSLYPNAEISKYLRQNYILHWQPVRSVPKLTVDFGDGRKLERTITGNSIHYILNSSGRPIDAIPGLYGSKAFLRQLVDGVKVVKEYDQVAANQQESFLRNYHRQKLVAIQSQWQGDLKKLGIKNIPKLVELPANSNNASSAPVAGTIAVSKMRVEAPLLRNIVPSSSNPNPLREITDQATWTKIAQLHQADAKLDQNSITLIAAKRFEKGNSTNLRQIVGNFENAIALDSIRNEYALHSQIHQWFTQGNTTGNVNTLNQKVYAELFLTPNSDAWLGLMSNEGYSAIDNDGIRN